LEEKTKLAVAPSHNRGHKEGGLAQEVSARYLPLSFGGRFKMQVAGLNAWFEENQVLRDVNLNIRADSVNAILGRAGAGKTTLLRCLNRTHESLATAGVFGWVFLDGDDIYDQESDPLTISREVAFVSAKLGLLKELSIFDVIALGMDQRGRSEPEEIALTVERVMEKTSLGSLFQTSGSMTVREL
jgi:phosphate transport system ATP-binding protein